jgi:ATP-dependent DNA helicase RecG
MTREELLERLSGFEWNDFEVKEAAWAVPKSAYESVSAFANTAGGFLVFGVREANGKFEVAGVINVDKIQADFITTLRAGQKLSKVIDPGADLVDCTGNQVLIFFIPEAHRRDKPVYLNGDINEAFVRRGGVDLHCTMDQIKAFLRDADTVPYDCQLVGDFDIERCFENESLAWYRSVFAARGHKYDPVVNDLDFLRRFAFVRERDGKYYPTRAAILLFGTEAAVRQLLGRPIVDCLKIGAGRDDLQPAERYSDRVICEGNLIETWRLINEWYLRHAEKPFSLDPATLQRSDSPPEQEAFREAAINLLIHQDYADQSRIPFIKFFRDAAVFYNPGHAFASDAELLAPGDKEVRNQALRLGFRMIGFGEQAGTGIPAMMRGWQQLGYLPPRIRNDKEQRTFEVSMLRELLLSDHQLYFQASLGVSLTDEEARLFAYVCHRQQVTEIEARLVLPLPAAEFRRVLEKLRVQALIVPSASGSNWLLAEHLRERFANFGQEQPNLVTDQVGVDPANLVTDQAQPRREALAELSNTQVKILELCAVPRRLADLIDTLKFTNRTFFRQKHLEPLVGGGILALQYPESRKHPRQAYVLTDAGMRLLENRRARQRQENEK